ncbi:hypothetical protein [Paenibacillus durus]|uniref:Uncharacterized protein n=1 Tax=Paenibacillus durus ATCC 35681 TaxID=1333534 RepID=A0A0F7CJD9_PAEDU|nr:hypothetical protein [Paenibacillus durus]AKG36071.1 hypothetical protein VK70_17155 [Paenibacillus durus ATCC 35681]
MDKVTAGAFEKLQKREHLLRVARERMALGRSSREEFKERQAEILRQYALTEAEETAYNLYSQINRQRRS